MIKPISSWPYAAAVRTANINCTKKLENVDTMDTKDLALSSDNVHYNTASMVKIGTISAQRWLNMHYNYGTTTPVIAHLYSQTPATLPQPQASSLPIVNMFDLSGRKLCGARAGSLVQTLSPHCVVIMASDRNGGIGRSEKTIVIGR